MTTQPGSSFQQRPSTPLAWWAVGLALASFVMHVLNSAVFMRLAEDVPWRQTVLPFYGIFMMLCGVAAGVVGLIAMLKKHEHSWMVVLATLFGASALLFVVGEFLVPH